MIRAFRLNDCWQFNSVANKNNNVVVNIDCGSDCKCHRPAGISANRLFKAKVTLAVLKNKSAKRSPAWQETGGERKCRVPAERDVHGIRYFNQNDLG